MRFFFSFSFLFIWLCWVLLAAHRIFQLRHLGSLVVACELLVVTCGIQFPDQGSNPGPLHWECIVLATGHQGSPCKVLIYFPTSKVYSPMSVLLLDLGSTSQQGFLLNPSHFTASILCNELTSLLCTQNSTNCVPSFAESRRVIHTILCRSEFSPRTQLRKAGWKKKKGWLGYMYMYS